MPPISAELQDDIAKRLRQQRDDLLATIHGRTDGDPDEPPAIAPMAHMGQNDDAPAAEMLSHNEEHMAEHDSDQLAAVDAALSRLESGDYGICVSCGCEIPEARLVATPTVQTCIPCQERIEREQGTGRGPSM